MILECTACHSRFLVADAMIPPHGRTVKCGACTNQWFVASPNGTAEPEPAEIAPPPMPHAAPMPTPNVPAVAKRTIPCKPFMIAAPVLALVWLVLGFFAYFPSWQNAPVLSSIYHSIGVLPTDGLIFADVHMEREEVGGGKTQFILTGSVVNHAGEARTVPTVRVKLKNAAGIAIWSREYAVNVALKPGEVYPFRINNVETSFAANITSIVLDVGHSLQLMMRS